MSNVTTGVAKAQAGLPPTFVCFMPDASLAGDIDQGTELVFERDAIAKPGKVVLIQDAKGRRYIRRHVSIERGITVMAVMRFRAA